MLHEELLNISVGAQSISPFYWSIRSGNLNSARAILQDLLTIRADRDVYYYACDDLFVRHPDVVKYLMTDVPALLQTLFDGLVWRSRWISKGPPWQDRRHAVITLRKNRYLQRHLEVSLHRCGLDEVTCMDCSISCFPVLMNFECLTLIDFSKYGWGYWKSIG